MLDIPVRLSCDKVHAQGRFELESLTFPPPDKFKDIVRVVCKLYSFFYKLKFLADIDYIFRVG
ncbi:hypothetical protein SDC9_145541 [bioreactor metagenome]|uniref:Uncharacterized protein n=1 Tax=bioreactor metagenome TaxID=1076179 RepID=A0A645EA69_9ZZZZ